MRHFILNYKEYDFEMFFSKYDFALFFSNVNTNFKTYSFNNSIMCIIVYYKKSVQICVYYFSP